MVLELAQPIAFLLSILSLYSVFHAAFLTPASLDDRIHHALLRLAFAAAIAVVSAYIFREADLQADARFDAEFAAHFGRGFGSPSTQPPTPSLVTTLPLRLFCWTVAAMAVLFAVSWYVETYVVLYRDIHY